MVECGVEKNSTDEFFFCLIFFSLLFFSVIYALKNQMMIMKHVPNFMLHPIVWPAGPADPANGRFFRGNFKNSKNFEKISFPTFIQFEFENTIYEQSLKHVSSVTSHEGVSLPFN